MKVLVVDDHPLIPEALATILSVLDQHCSVEGVATLQSALERSAVAPPPDLVLLDLGLPGHSGMSALAAFRAARPEQAVVVISGDASRERVMAALDLGAMGFVPKTAKKDVLLGALRLVLSGGIYVPPEVLHDEAGDGRAQGAQAASAAPVRRAADIGLTGRQEQVLGLLLRGLPNKLICRELNLAEGTVKIHVSAILKVLGVANRTQAVLAANRIGLRI